MHEPSFIHRTPGGFWPHPTVRGNKVIAGQHRIANARRSGMPITVYDVKTKQYVRVTWKRRHG